MFMFFRRLIFHPLFVGFAALMGAAICAFYVTRGFSGDRLIAQTFYVVPIVVPFVAFLFDRAERLQRRAVIQFIVDFLVVGLAMGRVVGNVPYVSGHTIFLTYALCSSCSRVVLVTAAIVMLHTLYLKYVVWHDLVTSSSGIVLGLMAALVTWWFGRRGSHGKSRPGDLPD
ncbi:MAG: hypothetical protein QOD75_2826 [Blastocatellia bacterium]|jgi:hypothetical protein|nr:hypothetical protein [Blastocatellia bacterium]